MPGEIVDLLDLNLAWRRARHEIAGDRCFGVHPHETRLIQTTEAAWLEELADDLSSGRFEPGSLDICQVPKPKGAIRPGGRLSLRDHVVYTACVGFYSPDIRSLLTWSDRPRDFSHPIARNPSSPEWLGNPFGLWKQFGEASLIRIEQGATHVVVTDIAGFYENIDIALMLSDLRGVGVPEEWLVDVRATTEDSIFEVVEHLPREAAEALLDLAVGVTPALAPVETGPAADPFDHVDAQRRFRVITDVEELAGAMDAPWDKWAVFLHPAQRDVAERRFNGPARVSGSAGTGKTVVALHRAVNLAKRDPDGRMLLATFSPALANALRISLRRLIGSEPRLGERIEVSALDDVALRLYQRNIGKVTVATQADIVSIISDAMHRVDPGKFTAAFLGTEWWHVVDAWRLESWEAYRDVARLGRRTRLPEKQRAQIWGVLEIVHAELRERELMTMAGVYASLATHMAGVRNPPFEYVVVDEAQDLSVPQLRFLASIAGGRPDALFFAGDLGQRIFQAPFSWRQLGVDVRGRSSTLRVNYRTSHQIRLQADRLLDENVADVDGDDEARHAISVFNGPAALVKTFGSEVEEIAGVADYLRARITDGVLPSEMAVFVRSTVQLNRALSAVEGAGLTHVMLDRDMETMHGSVIIGPMHLAKGLEFRAVVVMACDDEVIPLQERIEAATDPSELEEVYQSGRHLLYVACTRARDHLMVSATRPESEF